LILLWLELKIFGLLKRLMRDDVKAANF
jgi:hypothetical protein